MYTFALLPFALLSLWLHRRDRGTFAGFGFLAALAPMLASGVTSLIGSKQKKAQQQQQADYERQQAAQAEAQRKAQWEAEQNSPQAQMQRMGFNMKLGRLLGAMGGRDKVPPSLLKSYDAARAMPTYTPGAAYIPKPTGNAGKWDFLGGLTNALGYLDTSKLKKPATPGMTPPINGQAGMPQFQAPQPIDTRLKF